MSTRFEIGTSDDGLLVMSTSNANPLSGRQTAALEALSNSGLLIGLRSSSDTKLEFTIPEGTVPITELAENVREQYEGEIYDTLHAAEEVTGIEGRLLAGYLVHQNFVPEPDPAVLLLPSCVEVIPTIGELGEIAVNEERSQ